MLDERELLTQLLKHYTLSCGINDLENRGIFIYNYNYIHTVIFSLQDLKQFH